MRKLKVILFFLFYVVLFSNLSYSNPDKQAVKNAIIKGDMGCLVNWFEQSKVNKDKFKDFGGETPFTLLAKHCNEDKFKEYKEVFIYLIEFFDITKKNKLGETFFSVIHKKGLLQFALIYLLTFIYYPEVQLPSDTVVLLSKKVVGKHLLFNEIIKYIYEKFCTSELNCSSYKRCSIPKTYFEAIIEFFIKNGVDSTMKDHDGKTVCDILEDCKQEVIRRIELRRASLEKREKDFKKFYPARELEDVGKENKKFFSKNLNFFSLVLLTKNANKCLDSWEKKSLYNVSFTEFDFELSYLDCVGNKKKNPLKKLRSYISRPIFKKCYKNSLPVRLAQENKKMKHLQDYKNRFSELIIFLKIKRSKKSFHLNLHKNYKDNNFIDLIIKHSD